jgi:hypothetical protein
MKPARPLAGLVLVLAACGGETETPVGVTGSVPPALPVGGPA